MKVQSRRRSKKTRTSRKTKTSIDQQLKLLKQRESRLLKAILRLESKKERLNERKKGKEIETLYDRSYEPTLDDERDYNSFLNQNQDDEGTDAVAAMLEKEAASKSLPDNPISALRDIFPKNFDLQNVEKEIQGLKSNAHRVEGLLKEADEALDSLVKSMGYMGVKPKRGSWAYRRWRKIQERGDSGKEGAGGLDLGAILNLASMLTGSGGGAVSAANVAGNTASASGSLPMMGMVGDLMKSPAVQNVLLDLASSFIKKGKFKLF
ncbi:hypothetical protein [Heliorestis convoluta]|uniref:Uncharacterized protein n=1 Tax=Heliorestis convoluta TaxID=356322 RepID=A0A5Q2N5V5_9FIRM|nr:hypothetical protein [Heliorestis convoluta]QGG49323.1 hypothetical protein FTV88_3257 [Heliorestis convoluta]